MRISDWSSDVCSSDLLSILVGQRAALDYNRNFFINGAGPGGIIEFPEELDDDEWRRFKRRWDSSHQGVANAHKVATLEGGAKWVERNYTYKDMQFAELTNVSRDMIREAFLIHQRSEEHTSELQSLMRISYAVFCLKNKKTTTHN